MPGSVESVSGAGAIQIVGGWVAHRDLSRSARASFDVRETESELLEMSRECFHAAFVTVRVVAICDDLAMTYAGYGSYTVRREAA